MNANTAPEGPRGRERDSLVMFDRHRDLNFVEPRVRAAFIDSDGRVAPPVPSEWHPILPGWVPVVAELRPVLDVELEDDGVRCEIRQPDGE